MQHGSRSGIARAMVPPTVLLTALLTIAVYLPGPAGIAPDASAAGLELALSLTPDHVVTCAIDPSPLAIMTGFAQVDQTRLVRTVVNLTAHCRWVCQVEPSVLHFEDNYAQQFSVTVNVPFGTLPTDTGEVTVTGSCRLAGVEVSNATATASISIQDYAVFELEFDVGQGYIVQGQDREMRLLVHNRACVPMRLGLSVKETPHGATIALPETIVEFRPNEVANYTFGMRTTTGIATGYQGVTFTVKASDEDGHEVQVREFTIPLDIESRTKDAMGGSLLAFTAVAVVVTCVLLLWMRKKGAARRAAAGRTV